MNASVERRRQAPGSVGTASLFVFLVVAVYADPLFCRWNFAGRDLLAYNLPVEKAIHDAYSRGRLPVWMAEVSGGRPLLPNPNIAALYPVRPALSLLPFPAAAKIFPVLHWAAAGIGMILLLRTISVSRTAAWVGAVTYVFSGVAVSEVFLPHLPGLTLLPWILWAMARPVRSPARKVLLLSVLLALDFSAGDVFTIGLALAGAVFWIFLERDPTERAPEVGRLVLSVLLGCLFVAPQIVATALWIPETNRGVLGMKLKEVLGYSVSPFRLLELLIPFPFGSTWAIDPSRVWGWPVFGNRAMGMFATLYAGAFAFVALLRTWRERAAGARFARVFLLLALAVSVPASLLPARWGELASPLPLRNPEKLMIGMVFSLAILAGLGLDSCARLRRRPGWLLPLGGLFALLTISASRWPGASARAALRLVGSDAKFAMTAAGELPAAFAEAGLLWMATLLALEALRRGTRAGARVSLLLLTLVPIAANRRIARTFREEEIFLPTSFARFLQRADPAGAYRTLGESSDQLPSQMQQAQHGADVGYLSFSRRNWDQYTHALWGRGTVFNYDFDAGDLSRFASLSQLSRIAARYSDAGAFFGTLGLRWGIRFRDQAPLPGYRRFGGDSLQDWDEQRNAYPDIRLLEKWREVLGPMQSLAELPRLEEGEVVLETGSERRGSGRPGEVRVRERSAERLLMETECGDASWLFVLREFWPYRTVRVDRHEVNGVPAQLAFTAVAVPAGHHWIEWREEVPGFRVSRFGPAAGLVLVVILWFSDLHARRRRVLAS